jgi:PAS domain S-box-containing protein
MTDRMIRRLAIAVPLALTAGAVYQITGHHSLESPGLWFFAGEIAVVMTGVAALVGLPLGHRLKRQRREIDSVLDMQTQLRKLSLAVEQSPESIVISDIAGNIEYVNPAFERDTGYSQAEVIGRNPRLLSSGKTPHKIFRSMWENLNRGEPWKGEFHNRRKDGSEFIAFVTVSPLHGEDGQVTHYVAVQDDITEKKRLGEELDRHRHHLEELVRVRTAELIEAKLAAEETSRVKSAFLANMSHEIRTPMNAIIGLTHMLQRRVKAVEQREWLDKIDAAGKHLLGIINDILDMAKIEAGKLKLIEESFVLGTLLDQVRNLIQDGADAKGIKLRIECDDISQQLRGDATRLRQALLNYASNAVKFTERGSIHIVCRLNPLGPGSDHRVEARFEVRDTGCGIAPEVMPRLFSAFEQADISTTRAHGGTGLGLAIVKRLAEMMNGCAGAESVPGQGSNFWFTARLKLGQPGILRAVQPPPVPAGEAALRAGHAGARLLLVEDDPLNRTVATELLADTGLVIDTAENGLEAVAMAKRNRYDIVLMDVQMPVMNGIDAARQIHGLPGMANAPILAMTANAFEENRSACLEAGMEDFISKPVDPESFYATLLKWLAEGKRG